MQRRALGDGGTAGGFDSHSLFRRHLPGQGERRRDPQAVEGIALRAGQGLPYIRSIASSSASAGGNASEPRSSFATHRISCPSIGRGSPSNWHSKNRSSTIRSGYSCETARISSPTAIAASSSSRISRSGSCARDPSRLPGGRLRQIQRVRHAPAAHRALAAPRLARRAQGRAEIHQRLVEVEDVAHRQHGP